MAQADYFRVLKRVRFELTGTDRVRYLNGQCSNDVRKLVPSGPAIQACILSARGKLDAVVWIRASGSSLIVECDAAVADALAMRLERYIVADDVTLEPLGPVADLWHWMPGTTGLTRPDGEFSTHAIARMRDVGGLDIEGPDAGEGLRISGAAELTPDAVESLRVRRGIPAWGAELGPDTLPAEAGLDRSAVDFHKGCYLGQEVVSRIESVGHANRVLRQFTVESGPAPDTGCVFDHPSQPGKPGANVTSVVFDMSKPLGLCYTMRGIAAGDRLTSGQTEILIRDIPV